MKKIVLIYGFALTLIVGIAVVATVYNLTKINEVKGSVANPTEIPIIGDKLKEFPSSGEIDYVTRTGLRNKTIFWAGKMKDPYKTNFFNDESWKSWNEAETNIKGVGKYKVQSSPDNILFYKSESDVNGFSISVYFMPNSGTFVAQAISLSH